ncbi:hypothetical protein [Pontibacillus sp. HMF3514]|uniref:hypothetical protein n=1 Tax=Pontibacillus sp. HMF3514 TaxID=2692425 RepID=UPI00131FD655|nr:hypothetical protein [Pontibacillus sp. HMF3514]QHE51209.1 hypothetical protein GS400_03825 [Pontibacillus sp. HMF3514]
MSSLQRICKCCGSLTPVTPFMFCDECLEERETVRHYLREHPKASPIEIAQHTHVQIEKVTNLVQQGSLVLR